MAVTSSAAGMKRADGRLVNFLHIERSTQVAAMVFPEPGGPAMISPMDVTLWGRPLATSWTNSRSDLQAFARATRAFLPDFGSEPTPDRVCAVMAAAAIGELVARLEDLGIENEVTP